MGSPLVLVGDISELIEGCSASIFLFYLFVIIGLIIMRFTHSQEPRLYKVLRPIIQYLDVVIDVCSLLLAKLKLERNYNCIPKK